MSFFFGHSLNINATQRNLQKPRDIKVHAFMTWLTELNHYLDRFPSFLLHQILPDDKIMDIVEYTVPAKWQQMMRLHSTEPVIHMDNRVSAILQVD